MAGTNGSGSGGVAGHFGRQVRRDRLAHGWSTAELARRANLDAAHLSRVENGRRPPTARIAAALDGVFTERRGWYPTWLEETRTAPGIPAEFRSWSDYEDRTATLRVWTPGIVDGLVQAQDYAAALIATSPGVSDDAAVARLNARMERQHRVLGREKPPSVTLLIDEAALYRQVGTAEVMAAQLCRLREIAAVPSVVMQVMPEDWQDEATTFSKRSLAGTDYVYCWVDGIHLKVRLEQDKVRLLVMIGVRADGTKELIALDDGHRESTESWLDLLRGCKRRGMAAPVLPVGDGALGFWSAVREVFPETREQRCWWHKIGNVLNALPKSAQPGAKKALGEIWNAEDKDHAQAAANVFAADYGTKWPKAAAKITDDLDVLLAFYDYPAEHWIHLRTTNPIESAFATVRLRQRVTKGPGSRAAGVAMAFKLIESAQTRWRAVNAPHLVALVRAGAVFKNGKLIERPDESEGGDQQVA